MKWSYPTLFFSLLFSIQGMRAQPAWVTIYDLDTPITQIVDVKNHPMGGFMAAGVGGLPGSPFEVFIIRLDEEGEIIWRKAISNEESINIYSVEVEETGYIRAFLSMDVDPDFHRYVPMVALFDESGEMVWIEEYSDYVFNSEKPVFQWTDDGGFAAIFWDELVFPYQATFVKGDSSGSILYDTIISFEEDDLPYLYSMVSKPDGYIVYAGFYSDKYNPYILCLDEWGNVTSSHVDSVVHAGSNRIEAYNNSIDSVFYYAGTVYDPAGFTGIRLIQLNTNLEEQWIFDIPTDTLVRVNHISIDDEQGVLLLLQNSDLLDDRTIYIYKIDKNGDLEWSNEISEDHYLQSKGAYLISDGRVLIHGSYFGDLSNKGMVTLAGQHGELPFASISGRVFNDVNENDIDDGEMGIPGVFIGVPPYGYALTDSLGNYNKFVYDTGEYNIDASSLPMGFSIGYPDSSPSYSVEVDSLGQEFTGFDFAVVADSSFIDLSVLLFGSSILDDYPVYFELTVANNGSDPVEVSTLTLSIDPGYLQFDSATMPTVFTSDTLLIWSLPELPPLSSISIVAHFDLISDTALADFELRADALIEFSGIDAVPANNVDSVLLDYWDISYSGRITSKPFPDNETHIIPIGSENIVYNIEFINPFSFFQDFMVLEFTVPEGLDILSFKMVGSSHSNTVFMDYWNRRVIWYFNAMNLAPYELNSANGLGYVSFSLNLEDGLPHGFEFEAYSNLYFNYDSVWNSNFALSILGELPSTVSNPRAIFSKNIYPNPTQRQLCIDYNWSSLRIMDLNGRIHLVLQNENASDCVYIPQLPAGMYTLIISDEDGNTSTAQIIITHAF